MHGTVLMELCENVCGEIWFAYLWRILSQKLFLVTTGFHTLCACLSDADTARGARPKATGRHNYLADETNTGSMSQQPGPRPMSYINDDDDDDAVFRQAQSSRGRRLVDSDDEENVPPSLQPSTHRQVSTASVIAYMKSISVMHLYRYSCGHCVLCCLTTAKDRSRPR